MIRFFLTTYRVIHGFDVAVVHALFVTHVILVDTACCLVAVRLVLLHCEGGEGGEVALLAYRQQP